jgi:hypothetical protein
MLVGNKSDLESQRKIPKEMGELFAEEEGLLFGEASAKSGDGVEGLFMEIGMSPLLFGSVYVSFIGIGEKDSGNDTDDSSEITSGTT